MCIRDSARGIRFRKATWIALFTSGVGLILGFVFLFTGMVDLGTLLVIMAGVVEIGAFFYLYMSRKFNSYHAWVECKNLKTDVTHQHITNMLHKHQQYKVSGNKDYKFDVLFFVSSTGFMENALKEALKNNVFCYVRTDKGKFKHLVSYWD